MTISIIKTVIFALAAVALTGCSTRVDLGAAADLADQGGEVVPRVSTKTAIATFDKYCYRNRAQPGRVVAALKKDGYKLLVTDSRAKMFGYAHPRRPMVAIIDQPGEPGCMTMVKRDPALADAYTNYVRARHGNARSVNAPDLESFMLVSGTPTLVFARDVDGTDELLMLIVE